MKPGLHRLTEKTGYMPAPVNTGILMNGEEAIIIDTGLDRDHGAKILRVLEEEGLIPVAVVNTHSHADHCGGNAYLQKKKELPVLAPLLEKAFIEDPYLESFGLYGGAHPPDALQNKFLKAKSSRVDQVFAPEQTSLSFRAFEITLVPLPGHSLQQTGILHDGVLFTADALLGEEYLDKHLIPFNSDIKQHRESLQRLRESSCQWWVPAHGKPLNDAAELIERNAAALDFIDRWLLRNTKIPATLDELLSRFSTENQAGIETISQYHLYRTAFAAHLTNLAATGKLKHRVEEALLKWEIR